MSKKRNFYKRDKVFEIKIFGKLTAIDTDNKGRIKCKCECGRNATYQAGALLDGNVLCCGCSVGGFGSKNAEKVKYFGKLTVVERVNKSKLLCRCKCGAELTVSPRRLFLKEVYSCIDCKDTRTESMKRIDKQVSEGYRKDMLVSVRRDTSRTTRGKAYGIFRCDCGKEKSFAEGSVESLAYGSCGCYKPKEAKPSPSSEKVIEIGTFTRWTVVSWVDEDPRYVKCVCDCGTVKNIRADSLLNGDSTSCGCLSREQSSARFKGRFKTDAVTRHELYGRYSGMLSRCFCKTNQDYKYYGGRGITVCERWVSPPRDTTGFVNFVEDMQDSYEKHLEIERLDTNGNYCPENCKWVNRRSQVNNTSQNRKIKGFGLELNVSEWAYLLKIDSKLIDDRLNHCGWVDTMENLLSYQFRDRKHHLFYKGKECTASEIFLSEGFSLGQRNGRLNKYGNAVAALRAEGVTFEVIQERGKEYLTFEEGLRELRNNQESDYEKHLLYKIEEQLKGDSNGV